MDRTAHAELGYVQADLKYLADFVNTAPARRAPRGLGPTRLPMHRPPQRSSRSRAAICARQAVLLVVASAGSVAFAGDAASDFDSRIAPLLARRCLDCHSGAEPKGGLDLARRETTITGGDSGPAVVPGNVGESLLWQRVSAGEMPPTAALPADEQRLLREWIERGANWGADPIDRFRFTTETRAGYDWWALQPIVHPPVPDAQKPGFFETPGFSARTWVRNEVDAFVVARLRDTRLLPSAEAGPRTLIRRLSFDLLGLPPALEDVESFVNDASPRAYEQLVDHMLGSAHYGERWARHWLDVVRYGESQGFERDKVRPNAWPYRDWVIRAFNEDLPYDEFARLQIAGDVLRPDDADALAATGFLVAGPYDEVGQQQQSEIMKAVVRQDELEDVVGTVGQTFLGLTVNCARCHDHKFDPVRQSEYYQLTAALGGVRHGERSISTPALRQEIAALEMRQRHLEEQVRGLEQPLIQAILAERRAAANPVDPPRPIAQWTFDKDLRDSVGKLHGKPQGPARTEAGRLLLDGKRAYVVTPPIHADLQARTFETWVQLAGLDQRGGSVISVQTLDGGVFDAIVFGEREPGRWMAGSDAFRRTQSFGAPAESEADQRLTHVAIVYSADGTITAYRNGLPYGTPYDSDEPVKFAAGQAQVVFGLRHGTSAAEGRMLHGAIDEARLYDRALTADEIAASASRADSVSQEQLLARLSPEQRALHAAWKAEIDDCEKRAAALRDSRVYAVTPRQPEVTRVLLRGNTASPGDVVAAAGISSLKGPRADFGLAPDASEADCRRSLAVWLTDRHNPLFARVIVNRLWHYHFGAGLVDTPNDFGFNGGRPSHPELLDYLAAYLIENGWSLKSLHRLIVTSATYRQESRPREDGQRLDAANRLLWRKSPLRLEAEELRDAMLSVAGQLNPQVGGPPFEDFKTFTQNSQFYEMLDPVGHEYHRRTIYRTWLRSGRQSLLDVFDCPDPSTTAPRRAVTTTPVQSLALLNNSFVLRMADGLAERVRGDAGDDVPSQTRQAFVLAYSREPTGPELDVATRFVASHGLPALCRVLFNSNEFLYVD